MEKWWWARETPQGFCAHSAYLAVSLKHSDSIIIHIYGQSYGIICTCAVREDGDGEKVWKKRDVKCKCSPQINFEVFRTRLAQKGNEPPPQPETFMMGEIVRGVYPELKKLRENGYSLKVLVRVFEENGVVITTNALSTYLSKLAPTREEAQPRAVRKVNRGVVNC